MGNSDSRAQLRGIVQILQEDGIPEDSPLWDQLWVLPGSAEDVFASFQPENVRSLLDQFVKGERNTLQNLLSQAILKIETLVKSDSESVSPEIKASALNSVRVFTRVLPFLFERPQEEKIEQLIWESSYFDSKISIGEALIEYIGCLLFLPGFSLPVTVRKYEPVRLKQDWSKRANESPLNSNETDSSIISLKQGSISPAQSQESSVEISDVYTEILWLPGIGTIGSPDLIAPTPDNSFNSTRLELLKLLLVCQSDVLYIPHQNCDPEKSKWLQNIAMKDFSTSASGGLPFAREIFYSLINTTLTFDPVGWGLPFGSTVKPETDYAVLVDMSVECAIALLCVPSWDNQFRQLLVEIRKPEEFTFIFTNIVRLLKTVQDYENSLVPGQSGRFAQFYQELLAFLWKLLESNKDFLLYTIDSERCDIIPLLGPLFYIMWDGRKAHNRVSLLHVCTFILLLFSGERGFGVALNKTLDSNAPRLDGAPAMGKGASYADLLVIIIHKMIFDGSKQITTLYDFFLTVLSNISPYVRSFGQPSSTRLLSLFERFSSKKFLFSSENNHRFVVFLLDVFNNAVQYQYEGNSQLVYTLCLNESKIRALAYLDYNDEKLTSAQGTTFTPTLEWFESWRNKLNLRTLLRLLDVMIPKIENYLTVHVNAPENDILNFVKETTMVGLLPVPHAISIRKYVPNKHTGLWFVTNAWGIIFLRNQEILLWDGSHIKLFIINILKE